MSALYTSAKIGLKAKKFTDHVSFVRDEYDKDFGCKMKWGIKFKFDW